MPPVKIVGLLNIERKEKAMIKYLAFEPNINFRSNVIAHILIIHFLSEAVKYLYRNLSDVFFHKNGPNNQLTKN